MWDNFLSVSYVKQLNADGGYVLYTESVQMLAFGCYFLYSSSNKCYLRMTNMKREVLTVLAGLMFGVSGAWATGGAADKAAEAGKPCSCCKIVVVDVEKVYQEAPQIKRGNEDMKKKFGARDEQLKARVSKFQKSVDEFKKNAPTMSEADKAKREKEIMKEQDELSKVVVELQKDRGEFQTQVLKGFQNDLNRAVTSIAEEQKADIVLNSAVVLNSNDNNVKNVTKDVLGKLK